MEEEIGDVATIFNRMMSKEWRDMEARNLKMFYSTYKQALWLRRIVYVLVLLLVVVALFSNEVDIASLIGSIFAVLVANFIVYFSERDVGSCIERLEKAEAYYANTLKVINPK